MSEPFGHMAWDVALIDPDGFLAARTRRRPGKRLFPHIGLGYLAASLEKNGERVAVLDTGVATRREIQRFLSHPYNVVGITATSFTFREAQAVARYVKQRYPSVPVFIGGPHTSIDPAGCLEDPVIDFALRGEGEIATPDFIEVLKRTGYARTNILEQVPGLVFRQEDGSVRVNPPAPRLRDLDNIPYPAWHLFPMRRYRQHVILSSRGCPMDCAFCAIRTIWGKQWIRREPEHVATEIGWLVKKWGQRLIHINDDNLTFSAAHINRFCEALLSQRLRVNWVAQGMRADAASPEILAKMRQAGCQRVSLGIESISPRVLEAIGKRETPEDMDRAVRLCQDAGIQVLGMFMVGNINDTAETVRDSIRFARERGIDLPAFYLALPYPGTRLWDYAKSRGRFINEDYLAFDHLSPDPVFETPEFTAVERKTVYREADRFCRGRFIRYHLTFWWPPRLIKRNGYEIMSELFLLCKLLFMPLIMLRRAFRQWSPGGTK